MLPREARVRGRAGGRVIVWPRHGRVDVELNPNRTEAFFAHLTPRGARSLADHLRRAARAAERLARGGS